MHAKEQTHSQLAHTELKWNGKSEEKAEMKSTTIKQPIKTAHTLTHTWTNISQRCDKTCYFAEQREKRFPIEILKRKNKKRGKKLESQ